MKYKLLPCLLAIFLTGCDRTEVTLSFTPEMASFSNEFDFDPLRGPVKDFTQTLMDEQGEVTKRVSGTLSEEGCFDSLELLDLENNTVVALVLDANYYRDAETLAGVSWETDDNGFVIKASSKQMQMEYRYDDQGYPLGKTTKSNDKTLSVSATPSTDPIKKLDYTAVTLLNNQRVGNVKQSCEYDSHANPVDCQLIIVDEGVKPAVERVYTIKNTIDYY
ncbi:TPA: YnfC family lipoprotein [Escherichia coli]